jgi:hypothetical protein
VSALILLRVLKSDVCKLWINMMSAAGFEPETHGLKERFAQANHCVFKDLDNVYTIKKRPFDASCPQVAPKLLNNKKAKERRINEIVALKNTNQHICVGGNWQHSDTYDRSSPK